MKNLKLILILLFLLPLTVAGQINVNNSLGNNALIQTLAGPGVTISGVSITGSGNSYGQFTNGGGIGISQGVLLTSGSISAAVGPNNSPSTNVVNNTAGNALLNGLGQGTTQDACVVSFTVVPQGSRLTFNYVFGSEEYHEFVNSSYNDVFGFFISGPGITGTQNIALIPGTTTPVAINTVNKGYSSGCNPPGSGPNSNLFVNNCNGQAVQYDGYTTVLTASACVQPNRAYTITLAIADVADARLDSGVFIQSGTVTSDNPSANFTLTSGCVNGSYSVTATASNPSLPNHWWGLMETSIAGDVSDPATLNGGNPVQPVQGGSTVTFNNLDPNKHYYIKHGIWDCFPWQEARIPVPKLSVAGPNFQIKDAGGNPKETFCIGEEVFLDGSAVNTYGNGYYIDIWDVTGGGLNWLAAQGTNGWASGTPNWINISSLFQSSVTFLPNKTYRIKLAINGPCGWAETTRDFTFVCCDNKANAAFGIQTSTMSSGELGIALLPGNTVGPVLSEEWCVYDAPNGNAGPYTLLNCSPFASSLILPPGKCYYITHKVRTVCGDACTGQTICNTGCAEVTAPCGKLSAPTNLRCNTYSWQTELVWDAVPGASSYVIEIQVNDPKCCKDGNGLPFSLAPIQVYQNSYFVNFDFTCYSWAVYAICKDGTKSALSKSLCMSEKGCSSLHSDPDTNAPYEKISNPYAPSAKIYPNPSKGDVTLEFESPSKDMAFNVDVYDMKGSKVKSFGNNKTIDGKYEINWSTAGLAKGIYCVNFTTEKGEVITKKLVLE